MKMPDRHKIEIVAAILLALVGVATSWSGYQSALWSGIQADSYGQASAMRIHASEANAEAGQLRSLDADSFMQWLNAHANQKTGLEKFYRDRFRQEFKPAFEAWIASDPRHNKDALPTPFNHPEYKLSAVAKADEFNAAADRSFRVGQDANRYSDGYVLATVILAMAMFFSGISQQFDNDKARFGLVIIAGFMMVFGLSRFFFLPVAVN